MQGSPPPKRLLTPLFWAGVIFFTSCFYISSSMWLRFVFHFLPTEGLRSQFREFWTTYAFFIVKGWHVTEYAILTNLLLSSVTRGFGWQPPRAIPRVLLVALLFAASDEWHQTFVPPRDGCLRDVGIDMIGATLAVFWFWRKSLKKREPTTPSQLV